VECNDGITIPVSIVNVDQLSFVSHFAMHMVPCAQAGFILNRKLDNNKVLSSIPPGLGKLVNVSLLYVGAC
jgi:hypothetical protein